MLQFLLLIESDGAQIESIDIIVFTAYAIDVNIDGK